MPMALAREEAPAPSVDRDPVLCNPAGRSESVFARGWEKRKHRMTAGGDRLLLEVTKVFWE